MLHEVTDVVNNPAVVVFGETNLVLKQLLLSLVDLLNALLLARSLSDFVLEHCNDGLNLAYLDVQRLRFPICLTELVEEFGAVHFGVVYEFHVLHLSGDEFFLLGLALEVLLVDVRQILAVVVLELALNVRNMAVLFLQLRHLSWADVSLEVKHLPVGVVGVHGKSL